MAEISEIKIDSNTYTLHDKYTRMYCTAAIQALDDKVDKEDGKGLSSNDYTTEEKTKLAGIADGATKVIVDSTLKDSSNAIANSAVYKALANKADNTVFSTSKNGLVPKVNISTGLSTACLTADGKWMPSYDASQSRTKRTFLAAPVDADGKGDFRAITAKDLPDDIILDLVSYGVSWKTNVADPVCTRVGNMNYHKTLPIQSGMRGCVAQMKDGVNIMYFLNSDDWRWKENAMDNMIFNQEITVTNGVYKWTNDIFFTNQYLEQWVRVNNTACMVTEIDTSTKTATLSPESDFETGTYAVELGAVLNGYDGEVMVLVPEFWIKSWDTTTQKEVRISPSKIDDTWEHQPRILIGAYHDTILNTVPENMGYLSTLEVNSAISVANAETYCRGGSGDSSFDDYITSDNIYDRFKTLLGKPITNITRGVMRVNCRKSGKEILSYLQYKRILYWLYVIEYANFNSQDTFNPELTSEGFRQGGLGDGVANAGCNTYRYNKENPLTPNGYTNEFGNRTNIKVLQIGRSSINIFEVPRWHGIENPFGDIYNNVDGIIIDLYSIDNYTEVYDKAYITDNPLFYSDSDYSKMKLISIFPYDAGLIKEFDLKNTAEIIPRQIDMDGDYQTYKCDNGDGGSGKGLGELCLGGRASEGNSAGLGRFMCTFPIKQTYSGFRSSCIID